MKLKGWNDKLPNFGVGGDGFLTHIKNENKLLRKLNILKFHK